MSLFSSFQSFAQNLVGAKTSQNIYAASNAALTVLTKPIQSVTGRFEKAYTTTEKQGAVSLAAQGATNALLVTAPFSSGIKSAVVSTVSKLSPTTKIIGTAAAFVGVPYLAANPSKIPELSGLPAAGADIPSEPSLEAGIRYVKDHPYLSAAALTAGLAALGFGGLTIAKLISSYSNTKAIKENTEATQSPIPSTITQDVTSDYKDQIKIIEAQTKSQEKILEAQTKQQKELYSLITPTPAVVAPSSQIVAPAGAKPKKKAKKKPKKKPKKKTRRSKKKPKKKKKKTIKRRKTKK